MDREMVVRVIDDIERRDLTEDQKKSFMRNRSVVEGHM